MNRPSHEGFVCWVCDNGLVALALIILIGAFLLVRGGIGNAGLAVGLLTEEQELAATLTNTPADQTPAARATNTSTRLQETPPVNASTVVAAATAVRGTEAAPAAVETRAEADTPVPVMPTPSLAPPPEYVLVYVPVLWSGSRRDFTEAAQRHADFFITETGIDAYFRVRVKLMEQGLSGVELTSSDLLDDLLTFAIEREAGDRYIGLTNGDLGPDGMSCVGGWSYGPDTQAVIAEADPETISAHELGHTFGLCDEYNYEFWLQQSQGYPEGCPNPYPPTCPRYSGNVDECEGSPAADGRRSIMAGASLPQLAGFNDACLSHLTKKYRLLSGWVEQ
jgi:hypothetical protein